MFRYLKTKEINLIYGLFRLILINGFSEVCGISIVVIFCIWKSMNLCHQETIDMYKSLAFPFFETPNRKKNIIQPNYSYSPIF